MSRRPVLVLACIALASCSGRLTVAKVASSPAGTNAITFSKRYPPGTWTPGDHAYRLVLVCPNQSIDAPVISFTVDEDAPLVGPVYLRGDGPATALMSPSPIGAVNPEDVTIAAVTLAGMTAEQADGARSECDASVIRDGLDGEPLVPGPEFNP